MKLKISIVIFVAISAALLIWRITSSKVEIPHSITNLKDVYENGFNKIMREVPDEPSQAGELNHQLLTQIRRLKDDSMKWAYIDDSDMLRALESAGPETKAWFALYLSQRSAANKPMPPYAVTPGIQPIAIRIQPFDVTPEWAGLFIVHEISHVLDQVRGLESDSPSTQEYLDREVVAYRYEMVAADELSKRNFTRSLHKVIKDCKFKTPAEAVGIFKNNSPCANHAFQELSETISAERPKSEYERGLRKAFFSVALAFNIVDGDTYDKLKYTTKKEQRERLLQEHNSQLRVALGLITGEKVEP